MAKIKHYHVSDPKLKAMSGDISSLENQGWTKERDHHCAAYDYDPEDDENDQPECYFKVYSIEGTKVTAVCVQCYLLLHYEVPDVKA